MDGEQPYHLLAILIGCNIYYYVRTHKSAYHGKIFTSNTRIFVDVEERGNLAKVVPTDRGCSFLFSMIAVQLAESVQSQSHVAARGDKS